MNDAPARHDGLAVRASDSEREQAVALLQRSFADGRLTQAELEERAGAAYAARTRAQLSDLTADLPAALKEAATVWHGPRPVPAMHPVVRLPPAGLVYWLLSLRKHPATAGSGPATALQRKKG
jgi:hypothetical protein